jgi:hypothetical protein
VELLLCKLDRELRADLASVRESSLGRRYTVSTRVFRLVEGLVCSSEGLRICAVCYHHYQGAKKRQYNGLSILNRRMTTYVIVDQNGQMAASYRRSMAPLRDLVITHAPKVKKVPKLELGKGHARTLGNWLRDRLHYTHQTVTLKWQQGYIVEFTTYISKPRFTERLLRGVLNGRRRTFADLAERRWHDEEQKYFVSREA